MDEERRRTNMAIDESFALMMAKLEGRIPSYTSTRVSPKPELAMHDFEFHAFCESSVSVGTSCPRDGKYDETVVRIDLESGWFTLQLEETNADEGDEPIVVDINNRGRGCSITVRAQGSDEAACLARMLELAGVALRRQIERNSLPIQDALKTRA